MKNNLEKVQLDYNKKDFPEFTDAQIISAEANGKQLNDEQIQELNNDKDLIYHLILIDLF